MNRLLSLALVGCTTTASHAQSLQRIVSSDDLIPGTQTRYGAFNGAVYRNGFTAFRSWTEEGPGLFRIGPDGTSVIAHSSHPLPGGIQITPDVPISIDEDGSVAFSGRDDDNFHAMLFRDGLSKTMVRGLDLAPGGGQFYSVGAIGLHHGRYIFAANHMDGWSAGIYEASGPGQYRTVVDTYTMVPGTYLSFQSFYTNTSPAFRNDRLAFTAYYDYGTMGLFEATDHGISQLACTTTFLHPGTPAPGGGTFTRFWDPQPFAGGVFFQGQTQTTRGIFLATPSAIFTVENIPAADEVSFDSDNTGVLWSELDQQNRSSLHFWTPEAGVRQILAAGDSIDGRPITSVWINTGALDGWTAVVDVGFEDGSSALYTITIPGPSTCAVLTGVLLTSRRSRRVAAGQSSGSRPRSAAQFL
jgi:hypothetical protein